MVLAWFLPTDEKNIVDYRLECHCDPPAFVPLSELTKLGIVYYYVPINDRVQGLSKISQERGFNYRDEITISREKLPDYDEKMKQFFTEHLHDDDEARYIIDGNGYFDIRTKSQDEWIRILCEPGDLIIVPAGIYHRFIVTTRDYIRAVRFFQSRSTWVSYNKSPLVDNMLVRLEYLTKYIYPLLYTTVKKHINYMFSRVLYLETKKTEIQKTY